MYPMGVFRLNKTIWATRLNEIKNTSDVILQGLIEMIYEGKFKPGQKLVQEEIANIFDVSRVPVRDAFQKLLEVKLAERVPRKGLVVVKLSKNKILELYQTRKILEKEAIALVTKNITQEDIEKLEQIIDKQKKAYQSRDIKRAILADDEFHQMLFSPMILGNEVLASTIHSIRLRIKHARDVCRHMDNHLEWILDSVNHHSEVIKAIKMKDIRIAKKSIDLITDDSRREIVQFINNLKIQQD